MCVIESKRLVPCVTEEDEQDAENGEKVFELFWTKPSNFIRMLKCEDGDNNEIKCDVLDNEVKFYLDTIKSITIYYEVDKNEIYEQLKRICS